MEPKNLRDLIEREDPYAALAPPVERVSSRPIPLVSAADAAVGISSVKRARLSGSHLPSFPLRNTGGAARVKRPSMLSLANSGAMPSHLRPLVETIALQGIKGPNPESQKVLDEFTVAKAIELVDVTCIEGFLDPSLIPTDHVMDPQKRVHDWPGADEFARLEEQGWRRCNASGQAYDPRFMYVDEIDVDDRAEFFAWCNDAGRTEAQAVAPFPETGAQPLPSTPAR